MIKKAKEERNLPDSITPDWKSNEYRKEDENNNADDPFVDENWYGIG